MEGALEILDSDKFPNLTTIPTGSQGNDFCAVKVRHAADRREDKVCNASSSESSMCVQVPLPKDNKAAEEEMGTPKFDIRHRCELPAFRLSTNSEINVDQNNEEEEFVPYITIEELRDLFLKANQPVVLKGLVSEEISMFFVLG